MRTNFQGGYIKKFSLQQREMMVVNMKLMKQFIYQKYGILSNIKSIVTDGVGSPHSSLKHLFIFLNLTIVYECIYLRYADDILLIMKYYPAYIQEYMTHSVENFLYQSCEITNASRIYYYIWNKQRICSFLFITPLQNFPPYT